MTKTNQPEARLDYVSGGCAVRVIVKVRKVRERGREDVIHKVRQKRSIGQRGVVISLEGVSMERSK